MVLNTVQIQEILKAPKNKVIFSRAAFLESRLRFHTETNIVDTDTGQPIQDFLAFVDNLIPKDKALTFKQLLTFPLPTTIVVDDIFRELERVFYSRNSNATYHFSDNSLQDDWSKYRRDKLGEPDIWKNQGWQKMKTSINSILVVDLPVEQTTERPEPYFYWLDISNIYDLKTYDGHKIEWLCIKTSDTEFVIFDDKNIYKIKQDGNNVSVINTIPHSLDYCPATFFWYDNLTEKMPILKKNPITKVLASLDWYLFFMTSKKHLDLYAPYPIYSAYEADCTFENNETGNYCDGGFLRGSDGNYIQSASGLLEKCPICSERRVAGPGSFIDVPAPADGEPDLSNPVQITTVDEASLKYNVNECDRLKNDIIFSCTGSGGVSNVVSEKEAINETQVAANFEGRTAVLNALKNNFERAQKFCHDTCCRLRYRELFVSSSISWGTIFYDLSIDELYKKYGLAKANGASYAELDSLTDQIIEVEYRSNSTKLQRMLILKHLEPYRHLTLAEIASLNTLGVLNQESIALKVNFMYYIDKFEREEISIVEFGKDLPLYEKIELIITKLYDYVRGENKKGAVIGVKETPDAKITT